VHAREQHLLLDDHVGARERGRRRRSVAGLPVEDAVAVVAHERRVR
jgi:hypothetical protein